MTNSPSLCDDILPYNKLRFEPVDKNYIKVVYVRLLLVYVILMACALFILLIEAESMPLMLIGAELVLAAAFVANMAFVRKIYSFKGYRLSEKDISYRSGIFFPKVTTIPFCKIQQVSVRRNPVTSIFGLYYIDVINGSQSVTSQMTIPGLSREKAEELKSLILANTCCDEE